MKIVVLGWGSLIWDPRDLRIDGEWQKDGPTLPIEFARVSRDGRLTLVLFPEAEKVPVLWNYMKTEEINEAINNLKDREGTTIDKIGFIKKTGEVRSNLITEPNEIKEWAKTKDIDAVIWTDLLSNFKERTSLEFNEDNIIKYLKDLLSDKKEKAKEYITCAPPQIRTRIREKIEERLGWRYEGNCR